MPSSPEEQLRHIAEELAANAHGQERRLEREVLNLEKQLAKARAARETARLSHKRLAEFQFQIGRELQCPRCWINHETRASLRPIGGGPKGEDLYRCNGCDSEYPIAYGL